MMQMDDLEGEISMQERILLKQEVWHFPLPRSTMSLTLQRVLLSVRYSCCLLDPLSRF
jgi:hypothetical protein